MTGFGIEIILKAIYKSFSLKKNLVAAIHLSLGLGTFALLAVTGSLIGIAWLNMALTAAGSLFLYYVLIRMTYILSFFALKDLNTNAEVFYPEAVKAFAGQRWTALLVPIVLGALLAGVVAFQVLLLRLLGQVPAVGSILNALLFLPFFVLNLALLILIFFGGNIVYGIMIEGQTDIWATIKAVCLLVIRRSRAALIYWLLAGMLTSLLTLAILVCSGLAFIPALGSAFFNLLPLINSGININYMLSTGLIGEFIHPIAAFIMLLNLMTVLSFLLSFLINMQVGVNIAILGAVQGEGKKKVAGILV